MLKKLLTKQLQINFLIFSLIIALFFAYVLNFPFLLKIYTNLTKTSEADLSFFSAVLITLPLLLYVILTLLTSYRYLQKPLSIILILLSAITSFSALSYNTIFDVDMLTNFIQTNVSEASSYFSIYALLYFIAFAILPCILIIRTKITYPQGIVKRLIYRIASIFVALIITAAAGAIYAIYVGVKMARAESSDQREEAKKRLINIIVAVVVTIALILFFNLLLPLILDATGVFESAFGDPGAGGESLAVMAKTLLRI